MFSFLLGLGLIAILRPICKGGDCGTPKPPAEKDFDHYVYQLYDKCYEFKTHTVKCPSSGAIEAFRTENSSFVRRVSPIPRFLVCFRDMSSAGTLLADLDQKTPVFHNDDDLVNKILADMNVPSSQNPVMNHAPPPPMGNGNRMISSPNPNTIYPQAIDPATSTAHLIGKDYPTPADFANVMHGHAQGQYSHAAAASAYSQGQMSSPSPMLLDSVKGNLYAEILSQAKQPLLVALLFFVLSLPVLNVMIGFYLPSLLRIGGDLTTVGLVVKSVLGGFLFWLIQRILVPLMSS